MAGYRMCLDCDDWCHDGELIDGVRCFDCYIAWRNEQDIQEAIAATGLPREQVGRIVALRNIERGKHAKAW